MMLAGLAGRDYPVMPAYYVAYEKGLPELRRRSLPVSVLEKRHPEAKPLVSDAAAQKLVWLPVRHSKGFWTVLLDPDSGRPMQWLPIDPY